MTSTPREPFISLIQEMLRLHGRIRPVFESVEKATGLSNMELSILSSIGESHHALTVAELGRSLGHPRQVIQRTVNAMVTSQLLEMADNPRHKRAKVVGLTPTGQTLKATADREAKEIADQIMEILSPQICMLTVDQLRIIRVAMDHFLNRRKSFAD